MYAFHRYHWFVCEQFCFLYGLCARYRKTTVVAPAPPTLETSGIFHDGGLRYPHIYGFATKIVEIR